MSGPGTPVALDARSIERAARSPCRRMRAVVAGGRSVAAVQAAWYPELEPTRISPFARAIGLAFEHWLLADDAARLRELYGQHMGVELATVLDLRPLLETDKAAAEEATAKALAERMAGGGPDLVLGARVGLATPAGVAHLQPDVLVGRLERTYVVGELKAYLDIDGWTRSSELTSALRQAAVGALALRRAAGPGAAAGVVDLVLRAPRRPGATVRSLDAAAEIAGLGRFVDREMAPAPVPSRRELERIPHTWSAACAGSCPLDDACRREAVARGELAVIGPHATAGLAPVVDLQQAAGLAAGTIEAPAEGPERAVADALRAGWAASEAAEAGLAGCL
ncbi:MAG TPA: hypothetical protein VKV25_09555 [Acidimicrobiales bacterium]|nr:hypothetical protein [Acidimicrobiales bacterium]